MQLGNFKTPDTTLTPADHCRMATCRRFCSTNDGGACTSGARRGCAGFVHPNNCPGFDPAWEVRVASRDDGSVYCSRTERRDYLDTTLGWFKRDADARDFAQRQASHG